MAKRNNIMKIETYCLANNEEKLMPYFMRHYTQFSDVILLESNSTDRTVDIAKDMGAEIWHYDREDEINDQWFMDVKNSCWRDSEADWVIIVDADEFVYHPDIKSILETTKSTIFLPRLFNMFSEKFPTTAGQIYEEVTGGRDGGGKMNLFKPSEIKYINYGPGCHAANPIGNVKLNITSDILTLHMRFLSIEYVIERNMRAEKRLSDLNKSQGWGWHVQNTNSAEITRYFENEMAELIKIL
jgi:glycosyltransferase involved in cell wall biosynthesis